MSRSRARRSRPTTGRPSTSPRPPRCSSPRETRTGSTPASPSGASSSRRRTLLRESHPDRLAAISARIERFARVLSAAGLSPADLDDGTVRAELAASAFAALLVALFLAPPALVGLAAHAPAYNLIGPLSRRLSRGDTDIVATIKVLGAFLFFPLTWIALGTAAGLAWGLPLGLLTGLALPLCGYLALLLLERWERTITSLRVLGLSLFRRRTLVRLRSERAAIVRGNAGPRRPPRLRRIENQDLTPRNPTGSGLPSTLCGGQARERRASSTAPFTSGTL